jgi:hypothetical protein
VLALLRVVEVDGKRDVVRILVMMSSIRQRSAYSRPASLRCSVTVVPDVSRAASVISYSPLPSLVHFHAVSSPILREITSTVSATMKEE